jgi:hypothetical protein
MTPEELGAYTCEVQVIDVHLKAHYGPTVKLRFANPEQVKQFRKGMRLQLAAVEIGDDESMVPETRCRPVQRKPYKLSQLAGMLCEEPLFRAWIADAYGDLLESPEEAADWVRRACGVASRSALDDGGVPAETFRRLLGEYDEWHAG